MAIRTVAFPLYLLTDADLHRYRANAVSVLANLEGESECPELPPVIQAIDLEIEARGLPPLHEIVPET